MNLAVIGTFYRRYENTLPLLERVFDCPGISELWLMCETPKDREVVYSALTLLERYHDDSVQVHLLPTPGAPNYDVVPYSLKHNFALDRSAADAFCYLDNSSMPESDKYDVMLAALEEHDWGAVYCAQQRTGYDEGINYPGVPVPDGFCVLNHTQVMHRASDARWPLEIEKAGLGDAFFWRELHARFGPFHPVGPDVLDHHHQPHPFVLS